MSDDLTREALADPASVTVTVVGKNGHEVRIGINGHERTALEFAYTADQEQMPNFPTSWPAQIWVPSWKRFTFTVTQRFRYVAEDFADVVARRRDTP